MANRSLLPDIKYEFSIKKSPTFKFEKQTFYGVYFAFKSIRSTDILDGIATPRLFRFQTLICEFSEPPPGLTPNVLPFQAKIYKLPYTSNSK